MDRSRSKRRPHSKSYRPKLHGSNLVLGERPIFLFFSLADVESTIMLLEFPLTILGSWMLFKKITKNRELQEWISILRESRDVLKEFLKEYKKTNGNGQST